jgi:hypothetical protein
MEWWAIAQLATPWISQWLPLSGRRNSESTFARIVKGKTAKCKIANFFIFN